jgi:hypothetical protein
MNIDCVEEIWDGVPEGSCVSIRLTDKEVWFIVAFSPLFNGLGGFSSNRVSCIRLDQVRDAA